MSNFKPRKYFYEPKDAWAKKEIHSAGVLFLSRKSGISDQQEINLWVTEILEFFFNLEIFYYNNWHLRQKLKQKLLPGTGFCCKNKYEMYGTDLEVRWGEWGASQVAIVVKNLPASAGRHETWFNPWVRKLPWRRAWQPTPVFLPGEFHGWRSLRGYSPWGHKESDMTEAA